MQDYDGYDNKVSVICPLHGMFRQEAGAHLKGQGCPECDLSWGELAISEFLKKHNIKYEVEKIFPDCKDKQTLAFDFFLPDYGMLVEYDGVHHFFPVSRFGGKSGFAKVKLHDKIKNDYCEKKLVKLLRIAFSDFERIDEILLEELK